MSMMSLDMFVFEIGTLPYMELAQSKAWRFATSDRFGARPASQYLGEGAETISLTGALFPGDGIGKYSALSTIDDMAAEGLSYTLVTGDGDVLGNFYIETKTVNRSTFLVDGKARKADFTLNLTRADD
jgi:uncharacterized protein